MHRYHKLEVEPYRAVTELLIDTWRVEQHHEEQSPYRYPELARNGLGTPVAYTGMTWTGFRPSDDPCKYGYHIPANLFAAKVLSSVIRMYPDLWIAQTLQQDILRGVHTHGTWIRNGKRMYCYEVDGLGGCHKMDDANVPSLLGIPYLDESGAVYDRRIWENTYEWVWSRDNPYFFVGSAARGIGSPHTPHMYVWPMSLLIRGFVDSDPNVRLTMLQVVDATTAGTGRAHESFHVDNPKKFTRADFGWANALWKELQNMTHTAYLGKG